MQNEKQEKAQKAVGEMQKRREVMADGRRYIIYYTFREDLEPENRRENEKREDV